MLLQRNPKKEIQQPSAKGKMVALWNPSGSDSFPLLEKLLALVKKRGQTAAVVEFPCLGIPRVAYQLGMTELKPSETVDQFLIDYDRMMLQGIHQYLHSFPDFDALLIQPKSKPDTPTLIKLQQQSTVQEAPRYLKLYLSGYNYIFVVLQGQMIHPLTFFSIREADHLVLAFNEPIELIHAYAAFKTLKQDYGVASIIFNVNSSDLSDFKEEKICSRVEELCSRWEEEARDRKH